MATPIQGVQSFGKQTKAEAFFAGTQSVERLLESYRPRDEARFDHTLELIQRGSLSRALDEHGEYLREAMVVDDLPLLLSGSVDMHVRKGYDEISENYRICFRSDLTYNNFRQQTLVNWGDLQVDDEAGGLVESGLMPVVPEAHQYNDATLDEHHEYAQIQTYGCTFRVTREMLMNDDHRSLTVIPSSFGTSMKRTINWHVAQQLEMNTVGLNSGPVMSDGAQLFAAAHGNSILATPLTHANVVAQMAQFANQTTPMGRIMNLVPRYLIVPPELQFQAQYLVSQASIRLIATDHAAAASTVAPDINILAGRLIPVYLEELTDPNDWYLAADYNEFPTIEIAWLRGRQTPELFTQDSQTLDLHAADGMGYKIRHDFDPYPAAWRGLRKMAG